MFEFHEDRKRYFDMQVENAREYVIPFIEETFPLQNGMSVLEIGCGEGGVLKAFVDRGLRGVGVELAPARVENGKQWLKEDIEKGLIEFVVKDIYDIDTQKDLNFLFDIILLKDVIEHIHDQQKLIGWMKTFLKPGGVIFFGFPPWQMPFGGHQQLCRSKLFSYMPYYHLLPAPVYKYLLQKNNEPWKDLLEIKETGISIERFERIVRKCGYTVVNEKHYLLNPIYQYKFGWKPKEQFKIISAVPWVRNFLTTCVFYLIKPINQ